MNCGKNDIVRIKKGSMIWTTNPSKGPTYEAGKNYLVTVHCSASRQIDMGDDYNWSPENIKPTVVWVGVGGYWCETWAENVELVEKAS